MFTHRESPTKFTVVCEHVKQFKKSFGGLEFGVSPAMEVPVETPVYMFLVHSDWNQILTWLKLDRKKQDTLTKIYAHPNCWTGFFQQGKGNDQEWECAHNL